MSIPSQILCLSSILFATFFVYLHILLLTRASPLALWVPLCCSSQTHRTCAENFLVTINLSHSECGFPDSSALGPHSQFSVLLLKWWLLIVQWTLWFFLLRYAPLLVLIESPMCLLSPACNSDTKLSPALEAAGSLFSSLAFYCFPEGSHTWDFLSISSCSGSKDLCSDDAGHLMPSFS